MHTSFCWWADSFRTPWLIGAVRTLWYPITFQLERNWISFGAKVGFLLNHAVLFIRPIGTMVNAVTFQGTWNGVPLRTNVSGIIDPWNIKQEIFAYCKTNQELVSGSAHGTTNYESRIFEGFFSSFTCWVFLLGYSFKLLSKYTQKCQYKSLPYFLI